MVFVGFVDILPWYTPSLERAPRTPSTPRDQNGPIRIERVALRALAPCHQAPSSWPGVFEKLPSGCSKSGPRVFQAADSWLQTPSPTLSSPLALFEAFTMSGNSFMIKKKYLSFRMKSLFQHLAFWLFCSTFQGENQQRVSGRHQFLGPRGPYVLLRTVRLTYI